MLWPTLTANGSSAKSSPDNSPQKQALDDFASHAKEAGNFIVGRRTFEAFRASGADQALTGTEIVVVSSNILEAPGAGSVITPALFSKPLVEPTARR